MKAPRGAFIRSALMEFYSGTLTENLSGVDNRRSDIAANASRRWVLMPA